MFLPFSLTSTEPISLIFSIFSLEDCSLFFSFSVSLASKIFDLSRHPERGYGVSFGSLDYYNKKHGKNIKAPAEPQNVITTLTKFNETDPRFPNDYNSLIASMIKTDKYNEQGDVYYEAKVDMMLWLEGWDADCFNAIHYDKITMKLKFRVGREILN